MRINYIDKNLFLVSLGLSLFIHLAILSIPFNLKHESKIRQSKIFVVDILKESKSNKFGNMQETINYEEITTNELGEKLKNIITNDGNRQIPSANYTFDREQYDAEFLKILYEKMRINDYLEREGVSGSYLFEIEIEGSGRVRDVKTLRRDGSEKLENYVKDKLYNTVFPPHGELLLTIKVNMVFQLE